MTKPTVFISYSHKDEEWKDRLVTPWGSFATRVSSTCGTTAASARARIGDRKSRRPMDVASVAVLLVSANFLTAELEEMLQA